MCSNWSTVSSKGTHQWSGSLPNCMEPTGVSHSDGKCLDGTSIMPWSCDHMRCCGLVHALIPLSPPMLDWHLERLARWLPRQFSWITGSMLSYPSAITSPQLPLHETNGAFIPEGTAFLITWPSPEITDQRSAVIQLHGTASTLRFRRSKLWCQYSGAMELQCLARSDTPPLIHSGMPLLIWLD